MKNVVLMAMISVGATLVLSGCGKSAIECDNGDAKKLVMEITESEIKNQFALALGFSYAQLKQISKDTQAAAAIIDKRYSEAAPTLTNIRTESMDNKLEKSKCAAEISYTNGNKTDITYNLSKTNDSKLYAEVFGLR